MQNNIQSLLKVMDEIRGLSFQVNAHESILAGQKTRVENITQGVHDLMALKTDYDAKSRALTKSLDTINTLLQPTAKR